ncbi:6-phosphogluconate dehydrogenase C-terminal domain-like protein [Lophium mytilinum]|uniref:6-phosphogluconate dehydrogenase C-terminal domain-like protein n=1 Tax=Lophium mytilinum TaxID=390894 RepID=A0A6A6RBH3_9PEZI|nr:6-phosphogluconate dehydrogenase C-terminal domain-like protein [Lophium mytilinum]
MSAPLANIGILSIGSMGLGIAKLLQAHNYRVFTNAANRSSATQARASSASISLVNTDTELVAQCDYILSIVPPRDAVVTAGRIISALNSTPAPRATSGHPLYFLDLNAIAPSTARAINATFESQTPALRFVDGGIIGGPPSLASDSTWKRPGIPISGPHALNAAPVSGQHLADTLNTEYVSPTIGSASGLKCCFGAINKGIAALALQSFSTASSLDVLPQMQKYLEEYTPAVGQLAARGLVGCPPKAYRWVEEMNQIGTCFEEEGGWGAQGQVFGKVAEVFDVLGKVVDGRGGTEGMGKPEEVVEVLKADLRGKSTGVPVEVLEQEDR